MKSYISRPSMKLMTGIALAVMALSGCKFSVSSSDGDTADVVEDLAPLSEERAEYAQDVIRDFYKDGISAISERAHPAYKADMTGIKLKAIGKLASDSPRLGEMKYFGHGFGNERDINYTVVQYNVPTSRGQDEVRVVVTLDGDCCQIVGFHINARVKKNFSLGGD